MKLYITGICLSLLILRADVVALTYLHVISILFSYLTTASINTVTSTALSAGQLPREMYSRLMLSINGVCESCQESNGATMCGMMM